MSEESTSCLGCGDRGCCTSYMVPLNGRDVWRLSISQRMRPDEFVLAFAHPDAGSDGFILEAGGEDHTLILDKKGKLRLKGPCIFLMQLAGDILRCGVYANRPSACRAYPMIRWQDDAQQRTWVAPRGDALCPPGSWQGSAADQRSWGASVQLVDMEYDVYASVVMRWNERVGLSRRRFNIIEYYSYLLNAYERLNSLDEHLGETYMTRVRATWRTGDPLVNDPRALAAREEEYPWVSYLFKVNEIVNDFFPSVPVEAVKL